MNKTKVKRLLGNLLFQVFQARVENPDTTRENPPGTEW